MDSQQYLQPNIFSQTLIVDALCASQEPTAIYSEHNMIIRFANKGMLELWGKDASVIGMPLMDAIPELAGQPFFSLLQGVWESGESYSICDAPAELIKGGLKKLDYFDYEYKALLDGEGKTWCILNTAREVTSQREYLQKIREKEKMEEALTEEMAATLEELYAANEDLTDSIGLLSESREHIRTIIEQAPVGIAMLEGADHTIEIANAAILKIWGRTESEVIGRAHRAARPELEGQPVFDWLDQVYHTAERKTNSEFTVTLYDNGASRDAVVNSIYQPIFSAAGGVKGVLVMLEEITEQVMQRRRNEKDQQMLALAIEAGDLATFYYEPATNLFSGNPLLHSWFGLGPEDNIDLSVALEVIVEEDRLRVSRAIADALDKDSDGHYGIEYRIQSGDGTLPRTVQAKGKVFYDQSGDVLSLNGTLRDITEQRRDEQRKDDFIGMVSHELKTPLTSIKAYLQLMQRETKVLNNDSLQTKIDRSLRQVQSMGAMINGFLNISRLDSGKMVAEKVSFDLRSLFANLQEEMFDLISTHEFLFAISEQIVLFADREKIAQVIKNLVGNAVKYSPVGSRVVVAAALVSPETVEIRVSDEGMGISLDDQQHIFERYFRVKSNKMGSIAGFGIGLYLCREIVELHGGKITVESNGDKGTTFRFMLPVAAL